MEEEFDALLNQKLVNLTSQNTPESVLEALNILTKLLQTILSNPTEGKFRSIKKTNKAISTKLLACEGVLQILLDVGFTEAADDTLSYQLVDDPRLDIAFALTEVALHEVKDSLMTDEQKAHEKQMYQLKKEAEARKAQQNTQPNYNMPGNFPGMFPGWPNPGMNPFMRRRR